MYLSNKDILKEIARGNIEISPFDPKHLSQASYDLALSSEFYVPRKARGEVDVVESTEPHKLMKKIIAKSIVLKPQEFCLAKTSEKIRISNSIIGILGGRSRFARLGMTVHVTSAVIQPGSDNHQILEIANLSPFTLKLYAGERVSQVYFERLESPTDKPYKKFGKIATKQ
ncbi:MAG: dCTP deaminase [Candidatus Micrarchaeota archaeon]|nr:dCTP deaminase [Candidatus Micrarchaeota archaeon]